MTESFCLACQIKQIITSKTCHVAHFADKPEKNLDASLPLNLLPDIMGRHIQAIWQKPALQ